MAYVKCPRCGETGLSPFIPSCPNCDFPIKAHFQKMNEAESVVVKPDEDAGSSGRDESVLNVETERKPSLPPMDIPISKFDSSSGLRCPECGARIIKQAKFCSNCGLLNPGSNLSLSTLKGSQNESQKKRYNSAFLGITFGSLILFVICWFYEASNGVKIADAELNYAAIRYVSTTMILGRICSILQPICIIVFIAFGILTVVKKK